MTDIVTIGDATLYHGDCLEILPTLPKVDAVVTDPPYGIDLNYGWRGKYSRCEFGRSEWDKDESHRLMQMPLHLPSIVWGGNYFPLPAARGWLVWDKMQKHTGSEAELAWTNCDMPVRVFRLSRVEAYSGMQKSHPTQKPIGLMEWCIGFVDGGAVLDPFMGSGTTGVACANLGRKFIGIEIERKYFDIACERIEAAYSQGRLFA